MNILKVFKILSPLILLLIVFPVFAQTPSTSTSIPIKSGSTFKDKMEASREKFMMQKEEKEKMASTAAKTRKESFEKKLSKISDSKKRTTVEQAQKRLEEINKKRTTQMAEFLARTETILAKVEARTAKAKAAGRDVTSVESAIASAKTAIATAKSAVDAQAGKTYIIQVSTDERGLKNAVGAAMKSLETDLRNTHKIVVDAKQAVQKVFSLIKSVKGEEQNE